MSRAPTSAAELLERALELTPVGDPDRDAVIAELVDAAFWGGEIERAAALAKTALSRPLPPATAAGLHETMARALVVLGRPAEAVPHADRLVELGADLAWPLALAAVFKLFAFDLDGAVGDARRAIALCEENDDPWAETLAYCVASWEENARGFHRHAVELADLGRARRRSVTQRRGPPTRAAPVPRARARERRIHGRGAGDARPRPAARRASRYVVGHALLPLRARPDAVERRALGRRPGRDGSRAALRARARHRVGCIVGVRARRRGAAVPR